MRFDELVTYVRIVERGSLSAAARATRQSLATVSRQLRGLEDELGVSLCRRTTRRLVVTQEGQRFYEHAALILRQIEEAKGVTAGESRSESLTVSLPITIGQELVLPRLPALLQAHPRMRVEVRLEDRLSDFLADGVDLVVRAGVPVPDSGSLIATPLFHFRRVLVAAPSYLRRHPKIVGPAALAGHDGLLQSSAAAGLGTWALERPATGERHTVEVRARIVSTTPSVLRQAAIEGAGVALLPDWLVARDLQSKRLRAVLSQWVSTEVTVWALYRRELRGTPGIRAFLEALPPFEASTTSAGTT